MLQLARRSSRRSSARICSPRRFRPRLEQVESRLAPGANVAVTTNPGVPSGPRAPPENRQLDDIKAIAPAWYDEARPVGLLRKNDRSGRFLSEIANQ